MNDPSPNLAAPTSTAHDPSAVPWFAPAVLVATAGGIGRVPFAPGTFGAMLGLPLSLATAAAAGWLASRASAASWAAPMLEAMIVAAICMIGIPICSRAATLLGRKDPGAIVFDEVASMPLALLAVPADARSPLALAVAFVLLRIFDIWKPFPCRQLEHLPSGLGIMADDWGAAAWTAACLGLARWQLWI